MSISTTATKDSYAGNNSIVTQYPITFKYFEESHVSVYFDGVLQTKGAGADYVMGGDGTTSTGYITTNVAQAGTVTVAITLDVPFDQPVVLQETGSLPAKTIEVEGFDRLNMQVRRVWRKLQDVLTFNTDEAGASTGTADNLIGFDGSGDIAEIPNSTFVQTADGIDGNGDVTVTTPSSGEVLEWNGSAWVNSSAIAGNMLKSVYDPTSVNASAFDMDSMVEGANTKILTSAERTAISTNTSDIASLAGAEIAYTPAGTGAQATTVRAKLRERITPADFGAVGDGSADDTAAIQAAIDHAESLCDVEFADVGAGYVQVDLGGLLYRVTSTLTINRKIKFGNGNLIVTTDFPAGDGTDSCVIYVSNFATERLIIHDLDIDCGLDVSDSSKRSNGIYATQCQRCLFTNVNMTHMREFGLYIVSVQGGRFENMILREWHSGDSNTVGIANGIDDYTYRTSTCLSVDTNDCLFSDINCVAGLYPMKSDKGSANLWNNCHFVTPPTEGVGHVCVWMRSDNVGGTYAVGNMFTGCYFDNGEVLLENGFKNSFTGCKFVDSSVQQGLPSASVDTAIRFKASEASLTVEGVVIAGCLFENVAPQFTKTVEGVGSWTGVDSISVIGSLRDGGNVVDSPQLSDGLYYDGDKMVIAPNTNDYAIPISNRLSTFSSHDDRTTGFTASRWGDGTEPVIFIGAKSRGTTVGTFGVGYLVDGDPVARFGGVADRGADFGNGAAPSSGGYIQFEADGAHSSFQTPFRMATYLTESGAGNAVEVHRIRKTGEQEITLVQDTAANLLDVTADINTTRKRLGLMVFDTTNNRIMVASGALAADLWYIADGSASITPV